ncbi:PTS lactose/cellobiose transporter subunit IIA [Dubosiella muris]|uniref:PTS lactose/cellobiose transporter subunit IIA n=1 Tax=Dubosiella muris TaxID=3038133 RepID=A0AC61R7R2_9FIRM|nr:PTS lactose/cellobiose transporter subunit IIA [Dubosiella muris]TGY66156.1 PTS lactose/cellobiose transporter subunit IIA [Dubosiella muris]
MENMELVCFQIISNVGMAKSAYVEAIQLAEKGEHEKAQAKMKEGKEFFVKGHEAHASLIQKEAAGEKTNVSLLLMHAEDQLMSAETIELMANTTMRSLRRIEELEKNS